MTEFNRPQSATRPAFSKLMLLPLAAGLVFVSQPSALAVASADYHFDRALRYEFSGNPDAAVAEYRRGLQSSPQSVDGHTRLGTLLLDEEGDVDGAISEFVTALSIDPDCHSCQSRLDEAVDRKNTSARDSVSRGNEFYRAGQLNRSAAAYRIAVSADPDDAEARNCLAWTLYRIGKLDEAMAQVDMALKLKVDEPEYINTLACIQFDRGDIDAAMNTWKKAIAKSKTPNPADLYGLAVAFLSRGDQASASKNFKEAVKLDGNYTNAVYLRDRIGMSVHALATHEKLLSISGEKDKSQDKSSEKKD